ncbi:MAG: DUF86 domain-containing protein [Clostridiales Family XIII bacterium]|jgi:uncharacterized protein with HEPN domain|nr:DUF86 domain-containing protein [Clostridiales Family XIII bacterium]
MNPNDVRHLRNMLTIIDKVTIHMEGCSCEAFLANDLLADACAMNIIALAEQAYRLTDECREQNPQIEWHAVYGMRNRFAHDYFAINRKILWDILTEDIFLLRQRIADLIGEA